MVFDGIWRLTDPLMAGEQVGLIQRKALRAFSSYALPLGVRENGIYDAPTAAWVAEYQRRKNDSGAEPRLPADQSAQPGDCDFETKVALGILPSSSVVTPNSPPAVAYSVPGTWGVWNDGPPWWVCGRLNPDRFYSQGVGFNTAAFLQPDPQHSYVEAVNEGVAELLRLALPDPRPKVPIGYSMGADVVVRFLHAWPADRRGEIVRIVTFGSPGRPPGADGSGSISHNGGISRVFTPDWAQSLENSYCIDGDMYPDAPGLLPFCYEVLTRMELSGEFLFYLFGLLTGVPATGAGLGNLGGLGVLGAGLGNFGGLGVLGAGLGNFGGLGGGLSPAIGPQPSAPANQLGGQLLGLSGVSGSNLAGFGMFANILGLVTPGPVGQTSGPISLAAMLLNITAIIQTLLAALRFLFTNAHSKYGGSESLPIFGGTDAVIDAAGVINELTL